MKLGFVTNIKFLSQMCITHMMHIFQILSKTMDINMEVNKITGLELMRDLS